MMINRQLVFSSLLLFAVIISGGLVWHFCFAISSAAPANPNYPDAFAQNITVINMDEYGHKAYELYSPKVFHYITGDRTLFLMPLIWMYQPGQAPWHGTSEKGEALQGNSWIRLWGNVIFSQAASANNAATVVKTPSVILYPKLHQAMTDQYITAIQPNAEIDGIGMRLNLLQHTLDLLSQVHGYYVPKQ